MPINDLIFSVLKRLTNIRFFIEISKVLLHETGQFAHEKTSDISEVLYG